MSSQATGSAPEQSPHYAPPLCQECGCTAFSADTFTHQYRPAIVPETEGHTYQRRFGPGASPRDYVIEPTERQAKAMNTELRVFRDAESDLAEVTINIGLYTSASITARLTPEELRELAACLLDAAHDIETLPAAVLAQEAA